MALGVHSDLIQTALFRGMCRVGVDGYISAVHLQVTVSIAGGNRGVDGALGGRQLTLDGGHHGGVIILLAANTGRDGLQLGDGGVHSTGIIRVILNPVGNLLKGVQAVLGIVGNQLCGQLLIGDGTGALSGIRANQGADVGDHGLQRGIQVSLGNLRLIGQSGQTLDGHVGAIHGQGAVGAAGGNQDVHRLLGNGQGHAVDLDALQDVDVLRVFGRKALGNVLQMAEIREFGFSVSHSSYPPMFQVLSQPSASFVPKTSLSISATSASDATLASTMDPTSPSRLPVPSASRSPAVFLIW